ncbi:MAG TPA: endonuclease III [Deltaproteobacteria bacterium]|nr:endonuclease III [Deltaproteobacteria bacterium]
MVETCFLDIENGKVLEIVRILLNCRNKWGDAFVTKISEEYKSPFHVLVSCVLSLRTKDEVTSAASARLFARANSPEELLSVPVTELECLIYPVGFYKTKAKNLHRICEQLLERFDGKVPADFDLLVSLPGVGRKTANLVLSKGFGVPAICVDTHVHRISNRLGWISTKTPEQTEKELKKLLPREYWIEINDLLVPFGQKVCQPISPWCSKCDVEKLCAKYGVGRSR